jgi:hypothetical protein
VRLLSRKNPSQERAGGAAQGVDSEFKHQYRQKKSEGEVEKWCYSPRSYEFQPGDNKDPHKPLKRGFGAEGKVPQQFRREEGIRVISSVSPFPAGSGVGVQRPAPSPGPCFPLEVLKDIAASLHVVCLLFSFPVLNLLIQR